MDLQLTGKRVLVTGGTRGIGRTTVLAFANAGARVVTCYHQDVAAAEKLVAELDEAGLTALVVQADVTKSADVQRLAEAARAELGGIDVIVNNAGADGSAPIAELALEEWRRVLDLDLTSYYLVTQAFLPLLPEGGGSVINLGASAGLRGRPDAPHYTAAKAAVIGLTRSLAKELGRRGIRVNNLAPGVIETERGTGLPERALQHILGATALGRLGTPEDVAGVALFLASDAARYVTGVTLNVDGGM